MLTELSALIASALFDVTTDKTDPREDTRPYKDTRPCEDTGSNEVAGSIEGVEREESADHLYCRRCAMTHLIAETRTESMHRSAEGMVGYVRCPAGHLIVHQFAEAYPKPKPPASVLALRTRRVEAQGQ